MIEVTELPRAPTAARTACAKVACGFTLRTCLTAATSGLQTDACVVDLCPTAHDPEPLIRHAVLAGDWRHVELLARSLLGCFAPQTAVAHCASNPLVVRLDSVINNYHRR
jgi:hypothetical protein